MLRILCLLLIGVVSCNNVRSPVVLAPSASLTQHSPGKDSGTQTAGNTEGAGTQAVDTSQSAKPSAAKATSAAKVVKTPGKLSDCVPERIRM
uniref:Uncharacterized protein n=1 Tax=Trichobilharzia regenti TaxID=157069 RepID=A0AA85IXV0_TRIRE|nr:unnamed protein product [Trichobilharzia regenti]